jgi:hypothetical protein
MTDIADQLRAASCCNGNCQVPERQDELCTNSRLRGAAAAEIERLTEAHERIVEWSRAYPLAIFPEPDLKKARELLEAGGMTLDAISAHAMRHVVEGVGQISRAALEPKP